MPMKRDGGRIAITTACHRPMVFQPCSTVHKQKGHAADRRDAGERLDDAEGRHVIARLLQDPGGDQSAERDAAENGGQHGGEGLGGGVDELQHQPEPHDFESE